LGVRHKACKTQANERITKKWFHYLRVQCLYELSSRNSKHWFIGRSSDLFLLCAFPYFITRLERVASSKIEKRSLQHLYSGNCITLKELTAAGTVLDFHQIPFSNGAKIGFFLLRISINNKSQKLLICHKVLICQWHNNRILREKLYSFCYEYL
jgi:hypothetical protein